MKEDVAEQDEPTEERPIRFPKGSPEIALAGSIVEPSPRWVRVTLGETPLADSKHALLVRDFAHGHLPTYYFPPGDVRMALLELPTPDPDGAGKTFWSVRAGDLVAENAAWVYRDPPPELAGLREYVSFKWGRPFVWYEEAERVFAHARDPYHRVDVLPSSRHVQVIIDGATIAETHRPSLLFETTLPTRYYIPPEDVRIDLLEPSTHVTRCPYKGRASYWSARIGNSVHENIVWSYREPIAECPKITGLLCFFNEQVDLYVDGALQDRPLTPWSQGN